MTKQQQYRNVSAGFALGLIANGYGQIPNDKLRVEFAFTAAWRKWQHGHTYPWMQRIATGAVKDLDVIHIITDLDKNKHTPHMPFYWEAHAPGGPTISIREHSDFDPADEGDMEFHAEGLSESRIPAKAWEELARKFVEEMNQD